MPVELGPIPDQNFQLLTATRIYRTARELDVDLKIVGGSITSLLKPNTKYDVDIERRTIRLINHNPFETQRSDDTIPDIDCVASHPDTKTYKEFVRTVRQDLAIAKIKGFPVPPVTIEPDHYHGEEYGWPDRKGRLQFVSSIDYYSNQAHLQYDKIRIPVPNNTMETWRLFLSDDANYTDLPIFHPLAHGLRYSMRDANGPKLKDVKEREIDGEMISKIGILSRMGDAVLVAGRERGIDYKDLDHFGMWYVFIDELQNNPDPIIRAKAWMAGLYWDTIGTFLSHAEKLQFLADKFTGG